MINFKQFISEEKILNEYSILGGLKSILSKIKSALASLKFGSKTKIVIKTPKLNEEIDLKSRLGYYSEYVTAYALSKLIKYKFSIGFFN
jgi:hypothetical protein